MKRITLHATAILLALLSPLVVAQKSADEIQQEAQQAKALFDAQNMLGALPLYKELHELEPKNLVYLERYAGCLAADAPNRSTIAQQTAQRKQALALFLEAQSMGDNSGYSQVLIENLQKPLVERPNNMPLTPAQEIMNKAEKRFGSGDLSGALDLYKQALVLDPKYYEAALFAGDAEYKLHHLSEAGKWYAQAVAINPNRETAYRYWGDLLTAAGEPQAARGKFVSAIVADPYSRTPWVGLQQWAKANNVLLSAPEIKLPAQPVVDPKNPHNVAINIDPSTANDPATSAWMIYIIAPAVWRNGLFQQSFPDEKIYRHSLLEESQSLNMMLDSLKKKNIPEKSLTPTLKNLLALQKDNMLDAWILISGADNGIAHDYAAYCDVHRDLLQGYVEKYIIH